MIKQSGENLDLARFKLEVDKIVDPSTDVEATIAQLDKMVSEIKTFVPGNVSSMAKLFAIRKYLYTAGPWNQGRIFEYDHDDPMGTKIENKLLANYLASKKGNCVSMPILFVTLADRMGLDVGLSTAPNHVFLQFTESETGRTYNVEATSGGGFTRDLWYKKHMPMTSEAIGNGLYLQKLSKVESAAVMMGLAGEYYLQEKRFEDAIKVFEAGLKYYPKFIHALLKVGSGYYGILNSRFLNRYQRVNQIPPSERHMFHFYVNQNKKVFAKAESLGWREPSQDSNEKYLQQTRAARGAAR